MFDDGVVGNRRLIIGGKVPSVDVGGVWFDGGGSVGRGGENPAELAVRSRGVLRHTNVEEVYR